MKNTCSFSITCLIYKIMCIHPIHPIQYPRIHPHIHTHKRTHMEQYVSKSICKRIRIQKLSKLLVALVFGWQNKLASQRANEPKRELVVTLEMAEEGVNAEYLYWMARIKRKATHSFFFCLHSHHPGCVGVAGSSFVKSKMECLCFGCSPPHSLGQKC